MPEGVKLSEALARRTKAVTELVEKLPAGVSLLGGVKQQLRFADVIWKNTSGESAPKYAALEVSDVAKIDNMLYLECEKPTGTAGAVIVFNGHEEVADGKYGTIQQSEVFRCLFGDGTGANGETYGPGASWSLEEGAGYTSLGTVPGENDQMFVSFVSSSSIFAVTMTQTGGSAGTDTAACTFTYTIKDLNNNTLETAFDPSSAPSIWKRTSVGKYVAATAGDAMMIDGDLSIRFCNEVPAVLVCS